MTFDDHIDEALKREAIQAMKRAERDRRERRRERSLVVVGWVMAAAGLVALIAMKLLGWW